MAYPDIRVQSLQLCHHSTAQITECYLGVHVMHRSSTCNTASHAVCKLPGSGHSWCTVPEQHIKSSVMHSQRTATRVAAICTTPLSVWLSCSPENMITEVQKWPSRATLEDLKECLDYCSTSWVGLYCRLGGAHLLLEVGCHAVFKCAVLKYAVPCCAVVSGAVLS